MTTYAIKTTLAMSAANAPAQVALPGGELLEHRRGFHGLELPLKTKCTEKKYVPIGKVIMAKVKLINFQMTELHADVSLWYRVPGQRRLTRAPPGQYLTVLVHLSRHFQDTNSRC